MSAKFIKDIATRRTIYAISKENFPIKNEQVVKIVEDVVAATPSSFNNQTNRAVVLFGAHHDKLWSEITHNALKNILPEDAFPDTAKKIASFAAGYGTVLFFQDTNVIKEFEAKFALFAHNFGPWSEQSSGSAQISVWTALALENVGASLQHYGELIQDQIAKEFSIPSNWKLTSQLVFGTKVAPAGHKDTLPFEETIKVFQ